MVLFRQLKLTSKSTIMFQTTAFITFTNAKSRMHTLVGVLALLWGAILLQPGDCEAQTCGNALAATPVIFPISGSRVIVGQTITITRVGLNSGDPGNCLFRNGEGFLLIPSGAVTRVITNLNLNPPGAPPPPTTFINCFG